MAKYKYFVIIIPYVFLFAIYSCDDNPSSTKSSFEVTVTNTRGTPIEGAILEGGIDWESFRVVTDSRGRAVMPGFARYIRATIKKNNYYSLIENYLRPGVYALWHMPRILTEIGDIEGDLIRFEYFQILTINYGGQYRVYDFDGSSLSEALMVEFPYQVKQFKLIGDLLWYTTHRNGIYVYSLFDSMNPEEYFHLDIDGYLQAFDVKDSLVVVGSSSGPGPIRLFSYHNDGTVIQLDSMANFSVRRVYFRSHYLITTGYTTDLYCIFDIADPTDIRFVYRGNLDGYESLFLYGDTLILKSSGGNASRGEYDYFMIDMSDPANPSDAGEFTANGRIEYMIDDHMSVGRLYLDNNALCVFLRDPSGDFQAVAVVSEFYGYRYHHGNTSPYFLIGEKLWKLEER
jgi:hypothetical protein